MKGEDGADSLQPGDNLNDLLDEDNMKMDSISGSAGENPLENY
jgi:hypothetical protein